MEKKDRELAGIFAVKGISWNELTETKKKLARKVYYAALPRLEKLKELSEQIEQYKFNKHTLAEELKISRKTLGSNNPEIAILIETLVKKSQTYHQSVRSSSDLKAEIDALKKRIDQLVARDCELIKKDEMYRNLEKEKKLREKQYDSLKNDYDKLKNKYEKVAEALPSSLGILNGKNGQQS